MNELEFIRLLKESLDGQVPPSVIRENIRYYEEYISEQKSNGRSAAEVLEELGDPRLIARTIVEASGADEDPWRQPEPETVYEDSPFDRDPYVRPETRTHVFDLSKWYWKLAIGAGICLVLFSIVSLFAGLLSAFWPLIVVLVIIGVFKNLRR